LGVSPIASELEIKNAYKQKALEWHPDKHSETEEARLKAEQMFKDIGEAYDVLHDQFKRDLYDKGYDLDAIKEREEMNKRRHHHQ
jgi:DnaJ-class molecular chaperone